MAAKRALIFSFVYYPRFIGGAELAVKEITDRIAPEDIEFHMITLRTSKDQPRDEKMGNIMVHRIGPATDKGILFSLNKYLYPFIAPCKAVSLHRALTFDFTWGIMANYSGFAALFFKLFRVHVPFILTLQEGDPIEYIKKDSFKVKLGFLKITIRPLVYSLFRMIFTHADSVQAISKHLADFGKSMGAKTIPVVVPNGVDVGRFSAPTALGKLESIKADIGKGPDDVFLVTAGRLVEKNATGDVIASLTHLPANVKFLILGTGELEADLKHQTENFKLGDRVVFRGFVSHDSLPAYLQACDIFIRPSISEGFGNSFVEAMAAGIPVIATPVGGIIDFLTDKKTGLFCEVHSPEDIARKVQIYMQDKNLRDEIVDNAVHMVVDHYDWKKIAVDMKEKIFYIKP